MSMGTGKGATTGPGGLTPRELEVARLIARGCTNREIAEELSITPGTAANHAEHIRRKLGFKSRTQIAAWVAQQRLNRAADEGMEPGE